MQVVAHVTIFINEVKCGLIDDEFFLEAITVGRLVIGIGDVRDGDALRTVLRTNPVGIGQIDADSRRWLFVATQHSGTNGIGCDTFDLGLTETRVDG